MSSGIYFIFRESAERDPGPLFICPPPPAAALLYLRMGPLPPNQTLLSCQEDLFRCSRPAFTPSYALVTAFLSYGHRKPSPTLAPEALHLHLFSDSPLLIDGRRDKESPLVLSFPSVFLQSLYFTSSLVFLFYLEKNPIVKVMFFLHRVPLSFSPFLKLSVSGTFLRCFLGGAEDRRLLLQRFPSPYSPLLFSDSSFSLIISEGMSLLFWSWFYVIRGSSLF